MIAYDTPALLLLLPPASDQLFIRPPFRVRC